MTPGVRPLIAGNWKMHGLAAEAQALARAVAAGAAGLKAEVLICPADRPLGAGLRRGGGAWRAGLP